MNSEVGMRPPAHRGHRGLRPGGKVEKIGLWTRFTLTWMNRKS